MGALWHRIKPYLIFALSWVLPGTGHFAQKKYVRGAVFLGGTLILLGMGLALQGQLGVLYDHTPLTVLYFGAKAFGLGAGNPSAVTFDIGTTYVVAAGLMNYLVAFHAFETAKGVRHV
jgi:hypothetical protein